MKIAAIIALVGILCLLCLVVFVVRLEKFREEMDYINMELGRCSAASRKRWKREKRRLWLWLLFFIPRS